MRRGKGKGKGSGDSERNKGERNRDKEKKLKCRKIHALMYTYPHTDTISHAEKQIDAFRISDSQE